MGTRPARYEFCRYIRLYGYISVRRGRLTVKALCRNLKVSESEDYRNLGKSDKPKQDELLLVKIKEIIGHYPDNDNYGVRRVRLALRQRGEDVGSSTVYRVMKRNGLLHKRKHHPNGIAREDAEAQKSENLIRQDLRLMSRTTESDCQA